MGDLRALIRCDGSRMLGSGHVHRTLVLARELRARDWSVVYCCRSLDGAPIARITDSGFQVRTLPAEAPEDEDARVTAELAGEESATWIIVDRYATRREAYEHFTDRGLRTMAIDDICASDFPVDLLLNQNVDALHLPYETRTDTTRLLGPTFTLVAETYREKRPPQPRPVGSLHRVLVFMGGGDATNTTARVVGALAGIDVQLDVVLGAAYRGELNRHVPANLITYRDLPDLADLMLRADVAVVAGGSVMWELCCMRMPMLLLPFADNQLSVTRAMHNLGAAVQLGRAQEVDDASLEQQLRAVIEAPDRIAELGRRAGELVDGRGASRVADALALSNEEDVQ